MSSTPETKSPRLDKLLVGISLVVVLGVVAFLYTMPVESEKAANWLFGAFTDLFGSAVLLITFFIVILLFLVACSKYGLIKLGDAVPEYSTFKWIAMMCSCGLGSATCYWAFIEWAYYIGTPGLGIEPASKQAMEMSVPYTMFHWGFSAWALYAFMGIAVAYHFHVRRNTGLSLSGIISAMTGLRANGIICRIVDIVFIFICFGGLSITLGVSIPLVTEILCAVLGIAPAFYMNIVIILLISIVYSLSSLIGLQKGMATISNFNVQLAIIFTALMLFLGPTLFIIGNATQSFGLMLQNYIHMSLFTDPIGKSGFPESWTIFYWLYWITYVPFTGIFIAKISKGRTIRSVVLNTVVSGAFGCFVYFGILGSTSLHREITGSVDMVGMLANGQANAAIVDVLRSLPAGPLFMILFCISTLLFLATTLDGAAFTMASTTTTDLRNDQEPSPFLRLFWCVMLSLVPLTMILIKANLNTIKTCAITTAIPIVFIMIVVFVGMFKWLYKDFGGLSKGRIEEMLLGGEKFERPADRDQA